MIRVCIVDDHAVVRRGFVQIVSEAPDMLAAGEAPTSCDLPVLLRASHCDVLVLDITIPERLGIQTLNDITHDFPHVRILMFSMHAEKQFAIRALRAGAFGYIVKASTPAELIDAIRRVHSGKRYLSPSLRVTLAQDLDAQDDSPLHATLTDREFQMLQLIAKGNKVTEIARDLSLSIKTIYSHRAHILVKLHMKTNSELIRYAIQHGIVS